MAKKGAKKKVAALPDQLKKTELNKPPKSTLFEKRTRNFSIGISLFFHNYYGSVSIISWYYELQ
jgi:hypothetical protein